jgi:hypothetical protein
VHAENASLPTIGVVEGHSMFFRHNAIDAHYGSLALAKTDRPDQVTYIDALQCEVVHVSGGKGICLTADRGVFTTYAAQLFDSKTFAVTSTIPLKGVPSRCRMSIDGRIAALTVFVTGHGYTSLDFSTQTLLIDVASGNVIADLENFDVTLDGTRLKKEDFNFWGVTFTPDSKKFYATLSTGEKHFLLRGDVAIAECQARRVQEAVHHRRPARLATPRDRSRNGRGNGVVGETQHRRPN